VTSAVIFDMDGVLVDTERFIAEAAIRFLRERGVEAKPADFLPFVGTGENRFIGGVAEKYGLRLDIEEAKRRTYEIYAEIVHGQLEPLPGVKDFIAAARARGLKLAVASSADAVKIGINLREAGIPEETFGAIVSAHDVTHTKPDPEIFLVAAAKLGVPPAGCLVVEDALNGVKAAKAAGMRCLGLTTTFPADRLLEAGADAVAPDLSDVPTDVL
jgi:HAD superfamily hydrolase (TIGR01509 family)